MAAQNANLKAIRPQLDSLRDLAGFVADRLRNGDVYVIGPAVREGWESKRKLAAGVTNDRIDDAVSRALRCRGVGCQADRRWRWRIPARHLPHGAEQCAVRQSLTDMRELPVKLDRLGFSSRAQRTA